MNERKDFPRFYWLATLRCRAGCRRTHAFDPLHGKLCPRRPFTRGVSSSLQNLTEPNFPELINQQRRRRRQSFKRAETARIIDDEPSSSNRYRPRLNQGHLRITMDQ
jgi:hypothetical protein